MRPKYVRYGRFDGPCMFVIVTNRMQCGSWRVEVMPCDDHGYSVSDPVVWDVFPSWWDAYKYARKQYKEFYRYVNEVK